jgi:hypothetical protein
MGGSGENKITACDINECWGSYAAEHFADLLNGDCSLDETVSDLRSLIGSRYDPRCAAEGGRKINSIQQLKPKMLSKDEFIDLAMEEGIGGESAGHCYDLFARLCSLCGIG